LLLDVVEIEVEVCDHHSRVMITIVKNIFDDYRAQNSFPASRNAMEPEK
jgi:hypothetical protein